MVAIDVRCKMIIPMLKSFYVTLALLSVAEQSMAGVITGQRVGTNVGESVGNILGVILSVEAGGAVPLGIGGMAVIAALSLIIGVQLIKRRK